MMAFARALALVAATASAVATGAATPARHDDTGSSTKAGASWEKYVRSPRTKTVPAASILAQNTTGNVANPEGMINGNGSTVLSRDSDSDGVPSLVVDFGQNIVGHLSIDFAGSKNTSEGLPGLKLAFSETTQYLTDRSDFTWSDNASGDQVLTQGTDQIAVKNEPYTWRDSHGCEYGNQVCSDGLHGFRYLKIWFDTVDSDAPYTSKFGSISISSLSLDWSGYLGTPDTFTGWFECSDEDLTQWWFDGVYTTDMGTDEFVADEVDARNSASPSLIGKQVLFDGAKRDRDPYVGDLAVAAVASFLSHSFEEASRNVLEDLALHQRDDGWIPPASINNYTLPLFDYPLWWVVSSVDLVMYTGNTSYAEAYWSVLTKTLDEYYPNNTDSTTNLLFKTAESGYGDYAFLPRSGPITYYSALYVHALKYAAQLAGHLGHQDDADRWNERAATVSDGLVQHNFDSSVGAFYDGGPCSGAADDTVCDVHAQDGNSIAILAGAVNASTANSILGYWEQAASKPYGNAFYDGNDLSDDDFANRVYAFISYFELAARFTTSGTASSAFDEIRRLYGWMATNDPKITFWEGIGPNGSPYEQAFTSMAHGWSAGIVPLLSNYVLGVTPQAPGFSEWQIRPVVDGGDLTWARGVVPTPDGGISVDWAKTDGALSLKIKTPKASSGTVYVPITGFANQKVRVDGHVISGSSKTKSHSHLAEDGYLAVDLKGGHHVITVGK